MAVLVRRIAKKPHLNPLQRRGLETLEMESNFKLSECGSSPLERRG